jgi:hypothetical protein
VVDATTRLLPLLLLLRLQRQAMGWRCHVVMLQGEVQQAVP